MSFPAYSQATGQQAKADKHEAYMQSTIQQPPIQVTSEKERPDTGKPDFPARLVPRDPYDATFQEKKEQVNGKTSIFSGDGTQHVINHTMTPQDYDYIQRKRNVQNRLAFEQWMVNAIDLTDPVQGKRSASKRKPASSARTKLTKSKISGSGARKAKRGAGVVLRRPAAGHRRLSRSK